MTNPSDIQNAASAVVQNAITEYISKRHEFYRTRRLEHLLGKDVVMFALRGVETAAEFVDAAFAAHESSSEEGPMATAWTTILKGLATMPVVEGGDLLAEDADTLWIIQIKNSTTTFTNPARVQTLRELQERVAHHKTFAMTKRKPVKAMIGVIRGPDYDNPNERYEGKRTRTENADIKGFTYRYIVGRPFWRFLTGRSGVLDLMPDWENDGRRLAAARTECVGRLKLAMRDELIRTGYKSDIRGVIALAGQHEPN